MSAYSAAILLGGWLIWAIPFLRARKAGPPRRGSTKVDKRARWGIVLQGLGFGILATNRVPPAHEFWRIPTSILFFGAACVLSWTAVSTLGKQWRIDAGLNEDHELVRSGPYRLVRHPIYASMLCIFLAMAFLLAPWPRLIVALIVFLVGIEIRVRIEDGLLASRFGAQFTGYHHSVPAYIPLIR